MPETFKKYRLHNIVEMRPYVPGEVLPAGVKMTEQEQLAGSPKAGDMIARHPINNSELRIVTADDFTADYVAVSAARAVSGAKKAAQSRHLPSKKAARKSGKSQKSRRSRKG